MGSLAAGVVSHTGHTHDAQLLGGEGPDDGTDAAGDVHEEPFDAGRRASHLLLWRWPSEPGRLAESSFRARRARQRRGGRMKVLNCRWRRLRAKLDTGPRFRRTGCGRRGKKELINWNLSLD